MKRIFCFGFICLIALAVSAQTHISIANPQTWTVDELTPYVGQTVIFDTPLIITDNYYVKSGSVKASPQRVFAGTNQAIPASDEYNDILRINGTCVLTISSLPSGYHRMGEHIVGLKAQVLSKNTIKWLDGRFMGNTRADLMAGPDMSIIDPHNQRNLLVCAMNLEYYLTYQFDPSSGMGPANMTQHEAQRTKTIAALSTINADIYGLVEIQQGDSALREIARLLNVEHPERQYRHIASGTTASGTYTQSCYIYDAAKVEPVGARQDIDKIVKNRKRMQVFRDKASGETFVYSINHFKAKSGSGQGSDKDQGDGQGGFNYSRTQEAQAVVNKYRTFRQAAMDDDFLFMGDLNAYGMEDPIQVFTQAGMTDLHRYFHADSSYSYTFRAQAGYLDHALCSPSLLPQVTGMAAFHINSDELDSYTYDGSSADATMFRSSDHDPVIVGLRLSQTTAVRDQVDINSWQIMANGEDIEIHNALYKPNCPAYYAIYTPEGFLVDRNEIISNLYTVEKPAAPGFYLLIVYANETVKQLKFIVR